MNCVSCDICVYHLWFCLCFFPGVFLSSRVTGACPVTTDLIMRVTVRTTTATKINDSQSAFCMPVLHSKVRSISPCGGAQRAVAAVVVTILKITRALSARGRQSRRSRTRRATEVVAPSFLWFFVALLVTQQQKIKITPTRLPRRYLIHRTHTSNTQTLWHLE